MERDALSMTSKKLGRDLAKVRLMSLFVMQKQVVTFIPLPVLPLCCCQA